MAPAPFAVVISSLVGPCGPFLHLLLGWAVWPFPSVLPLSHVAFSVVLVLSLSLLYWGPALLFASYLFPRSCDLVCPGRILVDAGVSVECFGVVVAPGCLCVGVFRFFGSA